MCIKKSSLMETQKTQETQKPPENLEISDMIKNLENLKVKGFLEKVKHTEEEDLREWLDHCNGLLGLSTLTQEAKEKIGQVKNAIAQRIKLLEAKTELELENREYDLLVKQLGSFGITISEDGSLNVSNDDENLVKKIEAINKATISQPNQSETFETSNSDLTETERLKKAFQTKNIKTERLNTLYKVVKGHMEGKLVSLQESINETKKEYTQYEKNSNIQVFLEELKELSSKVSSVSEESDADTLFKCGTEFKQAYDIIEKDIKGKLHELNQKNKELRALKEKIEKTQENIRKLMQNLPPNLKKRFEKEIKQYEEKVSTKKLGFMVKTIDEASLKEEKKFYNDLFKEINTESEKYNVEDYRSVIVGLTDVIGTLREKKANADERTKLFGVHMGSITRINISLGKFILDLTNCTANYKYTNQYVGKLVDLKLALGDFIENDGTDSLKKVVQELNSSTEGVLPKFTINIEDEKNAGEEKTGEEEVEVDTKPSNVKENPGDIYRTLNEQLDVVKNYHFSKREGPLMKIKTSLQTELEKVEQSGKNSLINKFNKLVKDTKEEFEKFYEWYLTCDSSHDNTNLIDIHKLNPNNEDELASLKYIISITDNYEVFKGVYLKQTQQSGEIDMSLDHNYKNGMGDNGDPQNTLAEKFGKSRAAYNEVARQSKELVDKGIVRKGFLKSFMESIKADVRSDEVNPVESAMVKLTNAVRKGKELSDGEENNFRESLVVYKKAYQEWHKLSEEEIELLPQPEKELGGEEFEFVELSRDSLKKEFSREEGDNLIELIKSHLLDKNNDVGGFTEAIEDELSFYCQYTLKFDEDKLVQSKESIRSLAQSVSQEITNTLNDSLELEAEKEIGIIKKMMSETTGHAKLSWATTIATGIGTSFLVRRIPFLHHLSDNSFVQAGITGGVAGVSRAMSKIGVKKLFSWGKKGGEQKDADELANKHKALIDKKKKSLIAKDPNLTAEGLANIVATTMHTATSRSVHKVEDIDLGSIGKTSAGSTELRDSLIDKKNELESVCEEAGLKVPNFDINKTAISLEAIDSVDKLKDESKKQRIKDLYKEYKDMQNTYLKHVDDQKNERTKSRKNLKVLYQSIEKHVKNGPEFAEMSPSERRLETKRLFSISVPELTNQSSIIDLMKGKKFSEGLAKKFAVLQVGIENKKNEIAGGNKRNMDGVKEVARHGMTAFAIGVGSSIAIEMLDNYARAALGAAGGAALGSKLGEVNQVKLLAEYRNSFSDIVVETERKVQDIIRSGDIQNSALSDLDQNILYIRTVLSLMHADKAPLIDNASMRVRAQGMVHQYNVFKERHKIDDIKKKRGKIDTKKSKAAEGNTDIIERGIRISENSDELVAGNEKEKYKVEKEHRFYKAHNIMEEVLSGRREDLAEVIESKATKAHSRAKWSKIAYGTLGAAIGGVGGWYTGGAMEKSKYTSDTGVDSQVTDSLEAQKSYTNIIKTTKEMKKYGTTDSIWRSTRDVFEANAKEMGYDFAKHGNDIHAWAENQTANAVQELNEAEGGNVKDLVKSGKATVEVAKGNDGKFHVSIEEVEGYNRTHLSDKNVSEFVKNKPVAGGVSVDETQKSVIAGDRSVEYTKGGETYKVYDWDRDGNPNVIKPDGTSQEMTPEELNKYLIKEGVYNTTSSTINMRELDDKDFPNKIVRLAEKVGEITTIEAGLFVEYMSQGNDMTRDTFTGLTDKEGDLKLDSFNKKVNQFMSDALKKDTTLPRSKKWIPTMIQEKSNKNFVIALVREANRYLENNDVYEYQVERGKVIQVNGTVLRKLMTYASSSGY